MTAAEVAHGAFAQALALATLLGCGAGVGLLAWRCVDAAARRRGDEVARAWPTTTLLGLFVLAAVLPNLFLLGVPRAAVLALAGVAACAGLAWSWRARSLVAPTRAGAVLALAVFLLLEAPWVLAATRPLLSNDAILIWWPKVQEVAAGAWPEMQAVTPEHATAFYPRGLAWLANLAAGFGTPDQQLVRLVPVAFTWLLALVLAHGVRAQGWPREGAMAALLFVLLPDVARQCHSGMADLPIAAAVLVAGLGLSLRAALADGYVLAAAAAVGAASIKEEGNIVLAVVAAFCALAVVRRAGQRRAAATALLAFAVLLPFVRLRATVPQTRFDTLGLLLAEPDMLLRRMAAVVECLVRELVAPASLALEHEDGFGAEPSWAAWAAAAAFAVLVPRRWPRPIVAAPAVVLVLAALATQVASSVDVRWHMRTTLPRLAVEALPLALAAALARLAAARGAGGGGAS